MRMKKTYSEMARFETFEERLEYLYIGDRVGRETFGNMRRLNQLFYKSPEWRRKRSEIIARDNGCDLGVEGCGLTNRNILVHHINPITESDIVNRNPCLFDNDNLVALSIQTHNFIHYGTSLPEAPIERTPNDMCPWKK